MFLWSTTGSQSWVRAPGYRLGIITNSERATKKQREKFTNKENSEIKTNKEQKREWKKKKHRNSVTNKCTRKWRGLDLSFLGFLKMDCRFSEEGLLGLYLYSYWCLGLCLLSLCLVDKKNQLLGLCLLLLCLVDKKDLLLGLCLFFWVCDFWILILCS